jgi:hypothetical protein
VPRALENLIMRCLAKKPADRPANADEIVAELDRIELDRPWSQADAREWWEINIAVPVEGAPQTGQMLAVR